MKKIKFMLVALFALLSSTMAFAQGESATTIFRYSYTADGKATINGFVAGYAAADMATVTITPTVLSTDGTKTYKVVGIASKAFEKNANIKKVVITSTDVTAINDAFAGCANLAEIDLSAATGVTSISAGAFAGTKIAKLDLSKTKITTVEALFGTSFYTVKAKDAVLWKDTEAADIATHNAALTVAAAGPVSADKANAYNATLDGAVKGNADPTKADAITAAHSEWITAWNTKTGELKGGDRLTAANLDAVNALDGKEGSNGEGADYVVGNAISTADAAKYNATLSLAKVGGKFTVDQANDYNATLTGAIATTWTFVAAEADANAGEKKIWTETYNRAAVEGYAYVGGVKEPAVKAVDPIAYASLTEVILPETWETIKEGAFLNCSALATIDFGTPKATVAAHAIETKAFLGTALTALDFSKLKIVGALNGSLLVDGVDVKTNASLKTVTLNKTISNLSGNFANCTALTAIDLTNITAWAAGEFAGSGLTEVTIPVAYNAADAFATIPANAFKDCTSLAKVTFAAVEDGKVRVLTLIGENAFANTALTAFTVPAELPYNVAATATTGVWENAFADCTKLTSFTYKPAGIVEANAKKVVADKAFLGCNDGITFYTLKEYAEAAGGANKVAPTHCTFSYDASPSGDDTEAKELTAVKFKNGNNKYFVKYNSVKENIKIAKANAKVYAAYNADDDATIVMQQFKTNGGYYHIAAGDNVIIISDLEKIPYEISTYNASTIATPITVFGNGSSWLTNAGSGAAENMLKYISKEGGEKRSVLEAALPGAGYYIFAWSNTTSATGWLKITSGSTFPQKTLYIYAKPTVTADGARINVKWLDENGNIEDETTAIQGIESVEEAGNGASYNLAGQKVNAAYKGVVIKDGKKYMMK